MSNKNSYLPLVPLFQKFESDTKSGKRLQKNGKLISKSTLSNYNSLLKNLIAFESHNNSQFLINTNYKYSKRLHDVEKNKYIKFYKQFTDYLYKKNCNDNYVGMLIKTLRSFFIYLNNHKGYDTGSFYKLFYIRKEETPIIVLSQEQLNFLIKNKEFENSLPIHIQATKDVFVFGCTVGLRFSDLMSLKPKNLETSNGSHYVVTKSIKTSTDTRIKLPQYCWDILLKYNKNKKTLLPVLSLNQFNKNLKKMALIANWTHEVGKERSKRGLRKEIKKENGKTYRFCDLMSSHTMRRTAITTLLILGMPEPLVRKISGHAPNSKEFHKYVKYSESFLDSETDKAFNKLIG